MKRKNSYISILFVFLSGYLLSLSPAPKPEGPQIIVNNASDSGPGTLREALEAAKSGTIIVFDPSTFPKNELTRIQMLRPLPDLNQGSITIDGSDNGVILDGSDLVDSPGLIIRSDGNTIKGLQILNFPQSGILLTNGAKNNLIGETTSKVPVECILACNLISANGGDGIVIEGEGSNDNIISGNFIGTDATGSHPMGNAERGIFILNGAQGNTISYNLVSGNGNDGVPVEGSQTQYNLVRNNYIGSNSSASRQIGNTGSGLYIANGAAYNTFSDNLICGNIHGVYLANEGTRFNQIMNNHIGTTLDGNDKLGRQNVGIIIDRGASDNLVGPGNVIAFHETNGIFISDDNTLHNQITQNWIFNNAQAAVELKSEANLDLQPPAILSLDSRTVTGKSLPLARIEIFTDTQDEGQHFEGSVKTDEQGLFTFQLPSGRFTESHLTATVTDAEMNTSRYSEFDLVPMAQFTQELPGIIAPDQVSTDPRVAATNLGLALFSVVFFGFTATVFNNILEDYREEILNTFRKIAPKKIVQRKKQEKRHSKTPGVKKWYLALLLWLVFLVLMALIQSFLDQEMKPFRADWIGLASTILLAAMISGGIDLACDLFAHKRWGRSLGFQYKIQWLGLLIALICVIISRLLSFTPGLVYGILGAIYFMPRLSDGNSCGKRALLISTAILVGGTSFWLATLLLPPGWVELEPLFLSIFLICLQSVFFELIPLSFLDGGDLWKWRKSIWLALFLLVFFCFYHFILNPNASDVQAFQQNGVITLIVLTGGFGLMTLSFWFYFPFRLKNKP